MTFSEGIVSRKVFISMSSISLSSWLLRESLDTKRGALYGWNRQENRMRTGAWFKHIIYKGQELGVD